jgi:hypothetical protein
MLTPRHGARPRVTTCTPQAQIDQFPQISLSQVLVQRAANFPGVKLGGSLRAPPGTIGFFLPGVEPRGREADFLLGREFAHVHPGEDGSLHMELPDPLRTEAVNAGWAELHLLAGVPTVSPGTVLVYAPRDGAEVDVVMSLIEASWRNAQGLQPPST